MRGAELALGGDDLGALLALGLRLAGDRALHGLRQLHVLDLDRADLDAPGLGLLVDDLLQVLVDALALGQEVVQAVLPEHRAQRGLGDLRRGHAEVEHPRHRRAGVDHLEEDHGADLHRHVVDRDHLLRWNLERDHPEVDLG